MSPPLISKPKTSAPFTKVCADRNLNAENENWTSAYIVVDGVPVSIEWMGRTTSQNTLHDMRIREKGSETQYSVLLNRGDKGGVTIHSGENGRYTMNRGHIDTSRVRCIGADYGVPPTQADFVRAAKLFSALQQSREYRAEIKATGVKGEFTAYADSARLEGSGPKPQELTPR